MRREYQGYAYRQATDPDAPWLFSFVATADDLLAWAGIPRRATRDLIGFQRIEDPIRVGKTHQFFQKPLNQSPTALILGLHSPPPTIHDVDFALDDSRSGEAIVPATLSVEWPEDLSHQDTVARVRAYIGDRLTIPGAADANAADSLDEADADVDSEDSDLDDQTEVVAEEEEEEDDDVELGRSILRQLYSRLEDSTWVSDNIEDLRELAKPGTIIDGQHRVLGADRLERGIPFSVTAIIGCSWAEQVYQFTVINYTARRIPDQFITANAALSLTSTELDELRVRLSDAGVKVIEYELMRTVNFNEKSPFYQLVNLTEKQTPERIGYKTMVRVAKGWYSGREPVFQRLLLPNLYPDITGRSPRKNAERLQRWKSEDWGEFFLVFWNEVQSRYQAEPSHVSGHTLWDVGYSQLMQAIVLLKLQEAFFAHLGQQDEETFFRTGETEPSEAKHVLLRRLERRAQKFLDFVPPGFFGSKWAWTGLSIGPGRVALDNAFGELVKSYGSYQYTKSNLVTGKTD